MTRLAEGGFGVVHRLDRHVLPGHRALAYKEFKRPLDETATANLAALVRARNGMGDRDRGLLDGATTWPLQLVRDGGRLAGYVMPLLDDVFFDTIRLPDGTTDREPRSAQWLVTDESRLRARGISAPSHEDLPGRLVLCAKVAYALGLLHRHGLVYGDMSLTNVLFSFGAGPGAGAVPRIVLVDCDGVRVDGDDVEQANTPDWAPPEIVLGKQTVQDAATDRYKLALFVLRACAPGDLASIAIDPDRAEDVLDRRGLELLRSGLGPDRSRRPSAKEWYLYLAGFAAELTQPPALTDVRVDAAVALRGTPVTISWRSTGATRARLSGPGTWRPLDRASLHAGAVSVTIVAPGQFTLNVENDFGSASAVTDPVVVLDPPQVTSVRLPEPPLPSLDDAPGPMPATVALLDSMQFDLAVELPELPFDVPDLPFDPAAVLGGTALTDWLTAPQLDTSELFAAARPDGDALLPDVLPEEGPAR